MTLGGVFCGSDVTVSLKRVRHGTVRKESPRD